LGVEDDLTRARGFGMQRANFCQTALEQLDAAEHVGERVVDLVRNTGRQATERDHALGRRPALGRARITVRRRLVLEGGVGLLMSRHD
jgi:hypothetical protein